MESERRESQRLILDDLIDGHLGGRPVRIADVTMQGAGVLYLEPAFDRGMHSRLTFTWEGQSIDLPCEVRRTSIHAGGGTRWLHSGVAFRNPGQQGVRRLRNLMMQAAKRQLDRLRLAVDAGFALGSNNTVPPAPYLTLQLEHGVWTRRRALSPGQPRNGFTVLAGIAEDDLQRLCDTYGKGDSISRQLLRVLADLAIAHSLGTVQSFDRRVPDARAVF
jgi:hypothetical protein